MNSCDRVHVAARSALVAGCLALLAAACGGSTDAGEQTGGTQDELRVTSTFVARGTGYYPNGSALEGGFKDRLGKPLHTLQQHLAGSAPFVSVAMDSSAFKYGTRLRIHELEAKYGRSLVFRVVDTGGAFRGKGRSRIDVCTASNSASLDPTINGSLHIDVLDETSGPPDTGGGATPGTGGTPPSSGGGSPAPADPPSSGGATGSGRACSGDGACNPGNDGSGEICSAGRCVTGCHSDAQCPGSKTCQSGQCR